MTVPASGRLVGREPELAELTGWLSEAHHGRGRLVVLHGSAGVGKTRLAEELAAQAAARGVPTAWGRCPADAGAPPLWPLRRILDQAGACWPVATEPAGESAQVLAASRFALFVALADALLHAAAEPGLLVLLEDLHWADSATVGALRHLDGELGRSRLLVVATTREAAGAEQPALGGEHRYLAGLDVADTAEYLAVLTGLGDGLVREQYAEFVHRQTGGNPLYVAAVARLLAGQIRRDRFDRDAVAAALAARPEFADLVRAPLKGLSAVARQLVEAASVTGEEFSTGVVGAACGVPLEVVRAALDEAAAAGLLRAQETPDTGRFLHALVRDGVAGQLAPASRRHLHQRIAAVLSAAAPTGVRRTELARHLSQAAGTPAEHRAAAHALRENATDSAAQFAYPEAAASYGAALRHLGLAKGQSPVERAELLLDKARAEFAAGAFGSAAEDCVEVGELAERTGRGDLLAGAALVVDGVLVERPERIAELVERALVAVPGDQDTVRAQLLARQAYYFAERGRLDEARALSARALARAERTGHPAAILACLRARHLGLAGPDFVTQRWQLGARAVRLAEGVTASGQRAGPALPVAALWGRVWRVDAAFELGDLAAVDSELHALGTVAQTSRYPLAQWHVARLRASREALVGQFAAGERFAAEAAELATALQDPSMQVLHWAFQQFVAQVRLATDTALGPPLPAEQFVGFLSSAPGLPPVGRASLVGLHLLLDQPSAAHAVLRQMTAQVAQFPVDGAWIPTMAMLSEGAAQLADAEAAAVLYPMLAPFGHLMVAGGSGALACAGAASRNLGRLARLLGRDEDAERHLRDAITREDRMGARPFAAMSRLHLAEVLLARGGTGRLTEAAGLARTALATVRALDMPGWVVVGEGVQASIGQRLTERTMLTAREREVVELVTEGLTNLQVAQRLFVSERTVETHVSHVLAKLGGTSRVDIVTWAAATRTG